MLPADTLISHGQYNIGHICTSMQCQAGRGEKEALRWVTADFKRSSFTFNDLDSCTNRFANALEQLGFNEADVFFTFLPKMPEQFVAFLGALKVRLTACALFANFGAEGLLDRLGDARAKGVITKKSLLKRILSIRHQLPHLRYIILLDGEEDVANGILSYHRLMAAASPCYETPLTAPETASVLHYTSGSTGKPKGVLHRHYGVLHHNCTTREVLDLRPDDLFWCTADQGWVTGISYGMIGPLSLGVTQLQFAGAYDAPAWFDLLEQERVSIWYTAPTALRMLMREDSSLFAGRELSGLRHIFSVGEPLNPEVNHWARQTLDKEVHDTWFQTETGGIMISNRPGLDLKPGSMGRTLDGIEAAILADDGSQVPDGEQGHLCLKPGWPSMFVTYLNNDELYRQKFKNGYYYSGDTAYRDADGYFFFLGRSDDIINTAGHLVSPFEVESALLELEEVAESGAVGVPDELLFEKVVVFVNLHRQYCWSADLELKIRLHVSNRVSSIATPQEILLIDSIPKNKSGKIMRRVLKARYLGTDPGDLSTLEI